MQVVLLINAAASKQVILVPAVVMRRAAAFYIYVVVVQVVAGVDLHREHYLTDRCQLIHLNGDSSDEMQLQFSVPQGRCSALYYLHHTLPLSVRLHVDTVLSYTCMLTTHKSTCRLVLYQTKAQQENFNV